MVSSHGTSVPPEHAGPAWSTAPPDGASAPPHISVASPLGLPLPKASLLTSPPSTAWVPLGPTELCPWQMRKKEEGAVTGSGSCTNQYPDLSSLMVEFTEALVSSRRSGLSMLPGEVRSQMSFKMGLVLLLHVNTKPDPVLLLTPTATAVLGLTPVSTSLLLGAQSSDLCRLLLPSCGPWAPPPFSHRGRCFQKEQRSPFCPVHLSLALGVPSPHVVLTVNHMLGVLFPGYILACFVQPLADVRCCTGTSIYIYNKSQKTWSSSCLNLITCLLSLFHLLKPKTWGSFQTFSVPWS